MAWPIVPADGVDYRNVEFVQQFYRARRERFGAIGNVRFPRANNVWDEGAITAITSTTVTIGGKAWDTDRWVGYASVGLPVAPVDYDLIIDSPCPPDPRKVIRVQISGNDADTLTVSGAELARAITERRDASIASLVGRQAYILGRDLLWWSDRWIEFPNDLILAHGRVSRRPADTPPVNGTVISGRGLTPPPGVDVVGKEILFYNDSAVLQRGTVTARAGRELTITGTTGAAVAGDDFVIVNVDGFFGWPAPGTPPRGGSIRADYRGMLTGYDAHDAADALASMDKPQVTFQSYEGSDPDSCPIDPTTIVVFDKDYWTDVLEACVENDHSYAPDIHKSFRHLWVGQAQELDHWVDPDIDYTGADSIPVFNAATWLASLGINSQTVSGGTVSAGALPYSISAPYVPIDIFFSVQDDKGNPIYFGETTYTGSGDTLGSTFTSDNDGASIVVSLGPTRYVRRLFQRFFDKTVFIPAIDDGAIVWPPTEDFPGAYVTRAASTHYLRADQWNFVDESDLAVDAFTTGDLARFVGDNKAYPSIEPHTPAGDDEPRIGNYERFFTGTRAGTTEASLRALRRGTATAGTVRQLTNDAINWWGGDFYGDGQIFTRSGTATGGSTTTLIDTTQAGSSLWDDVARSQVGLVVTVTQSGVEHKRLITSHTGTTIGFAEALPAATAAGMAWAIRETDAETNRYKGRTVRLNMPDPDNPAGPWLSATATIAGNDDTTLFFTADVAFAVDDTTRYRISHVKTGGVWKWDGSAWTVPTGNDARADVPFLGDASANLPTCAVRYGWPRLLDYVTTQNWDELRDAYNKLWITKEGAAVSNRLDPLVPENNLVAAGAETGGAACVSADNSGDPTQYDTPACSVNPTSGLHDYTLMHDEIEVGNHRFERDALTASSESIGAIQALYSVRRSYPAFSGTPNVYGDKPGSDEITDIVVQWQRLFTPRQKAGCGNWTAEIRWFCYAQIDAADHDEGSSGDGYDLYNFEPGPEPLLYRKWAEVDSISSSPDAMYHSRKIGGGSSGTFVHPDPPTLPPEDDPAPVDADTPGPSIIHYGGFYVSATCALLDWSGAFTLL